MGGKGKRAGCAVGAILNLKPPCVQAKRAFHICQCSLLKSLHMGSEPWPHSNMPPL